MTPDSKPMSSVQSIERAIAIMRCFTESNPELGVTEIGHRLGLHKSTVSRILGTLQHNGLVNQNQSTGKYRLGVGLISLAGVALGQVDVRSVAYNLMDELSLETSENVAILVLDGAECVNVYHQASPRSVRYADWIGRRFPLHCTASGKVLLADLSADERSRLFTFPLPSYTEFTITDAAGLEAEIERVRVSGHACAIEEYELGFSAVAVPICNHSGRVVAALSLSGPSSRLSPGELSTMVTPLSQTAATVSAKLGFAATRALSGG